MSAALGNLPHILRNSYNMQLRAEGGRRHGWYRDSVYAKNYNLIGEAT